MRIENEPAKPIEQTKKRMRPWVKRLIWTIGIFLVLVIGIGSTGLVNIPIISSILGVSQPKDLGVKASPEALASIQKKMPVEITGGPLGLCLACKQTYEGKITIAARRTSEEMTSFLQLFPRESGDILKNTQVRFIEGGLEISTKLNKYVNAPVYVKVMVNRTGAKTVSLNIIDGKVGALSVPDKYKEQAEEFFTKLVNTHLAEIEGFSMDKLEYHDGYSDFSGTYPKIVKPAPGKWTDAF